jgi:hypothetical protein
VTKVQIEEPKLNVKDYLLPGTLGPVAVAAKVAMVFFIAFFLLASGDRAATGPPSIAPDRPPAKN